MHLNSQFRLVQENDIAAMVDQQGRELLWGDRWKCFQGVPINVLCPVPLLSEIWGTCPLHLNGAGAYAKEDPW